MKRCARCGQFQAGRVFPCRDPRGHDWQHQAPRQVLQVDPRVEEQRREDLWFLYPRDVS